jgi:hypothetical protein
MHPVSGIYIISLLYMCAGRENEVSVLLPRSRAALVATSPAVQRQTFVDSTCSRMTYQGLFTLVSLNLPPPPSANPEQPQLFALFRNAHLSVLYKHPASTLYTLTTDEVFLREPNVVWEQLEDVDQGGAVFVDARFERSVAVGGDWAGWTPEADVPGVGDTSDRVCFYMFSVSYSSHCVAVMRWHAGCRRRRTLRRLRCLRGVQSGSGVMKQRRRLRRRRRAV